MIITIIGITLAWIIVGLWGFIYWWTTEYDLTMSEIFILIIGALMGPMSWLAGYIIHGKPKDKSKILVKKRWN